MIILLEGVFILIAIGLGVTLFFYLLSKDSKNKGDRS